MCLLSPTLFSTMSIGVLWRKQSWMQFFVKLKIESHPLFWIKSIVHSWTALKIASLNQNWPILKVETFRNLEILGQISHLVTYRWAKVAKIVKCTFWRPVSGQIWGFLARESNLKKNWCFTKVKMAWNSHSRCVKFGQT